MGNQSSNNKVYSVPLEGTKQPGFSYIYRNAHTPKELVSTPDPNMKSMKDVLYYSFKNNENRDFLGRIKIKTIQKNGQTVEERELTKFTYRQIFNMAQILGSYLVSNKMDFHQNIHGMRLIGIFAKNRYEWMVADIACMLYGLTLVPLYDTLGIDNLTYCLEHSGIRTLFVTDQTIKTVLGLKGHGNLQNLICLDPLSPQVQADLKNHRFKVFHFEDLLKFNQFVSHGDVKVTGQTCLTFSYTSGTTGPPKGAMLSHSNFLAFLAALKAHQIGGFKTDDSYVSFLPLPHIFERVVVAGLMYSGAFIAFYNGDVMKFKDDLTFIKPTILVAVPRLFNRIVEGVQKQFGQTTGIKGCLVNNGVKSKLDELHKTGSFNSGMYDSIVFSKVREKFGGRIRMMITGSAPIKKQTYEFMKIIMCCPFYEGYGQTECTAAAFITQAIDSQSGHVGEVASSLQFKLQDIPEMHYTSQDKDEQGRPTPRGQIWLRGPSVFMGYYKDNEKTKEAITADGWLQTGDVGMLIPGSNAMKIIDRKKNIFKLQQGQYVAAEKVQNIYSKSPLISETFLHGDSTQNFAVAVVVPNKDQIIKLAQKNNITGSYEQILNSVPMRTLICKELDAVGKKSGLMSFEQAKNIYCEPQPFANRGIVSSTMKLQRFAAKTYYSKQIEAMYQEGQLKI